MKAWERLLKPHMQRLNMRPMIHYLHKYRNDGVGLVGLELGCDEGLNAKNILTMLNMKWLYLVDVADNCVVDRNIWKWYDQITVLYGDSRKISSSVPNNLDFVYIDTDHTYETTKEEIELYYPKVKVGGVFGGHDFCPRYRELAKAVNEFCDEYGYELERFAGKFQIDWYVIKR